ncbi:MAG TPA: glucose-6-phosphate dehydrogenase [Gemmatimonadales bacterium]|nr:glucose-6-phosphate dehydrogenase [Gemmatimonadales bacterium]
MSAPVCAVFTIFGGTGDLARRKVLPALYALHRAGKTGEQCLVLGVARETALGDDGYRQLVTDALAKGGVPAADARAWADHYVWYQTIDDGGPEDYAAIGDKIRGIERERKLPGNRVFYLAIPPAAFASTVEGLGEAKLNTSPGWTRLVIEKPFGRDLASARELNALVHRWFQESQIYRIDHYLGKETVQNLLVFRFSNAVFESLWNRDHVDSVQITVAEDIGIGSRAGYYEQAGVVRDIIQNHATQLLALVAMEVPAAFDADAIRSEKIKALRQVGLIDTHEIVLGQYGAGMVDNAPVAGYRDEPGVARDSRTPTFAALKVEVDSWRWQGVPFYLRAGKRMARRLTEIVVHFRRAPVWLFEHSGGRDLRSNVLRLTIQPDEGFALYFNAKAPGQPMDLERLPLDFNYKEQFAELPEAYQTLLLEVLDGDQTLFVHADEVETAWALYAPVLDGRQRIIPYEAGTWGPYEANDLLQREGNHWFYH